MDTKFSNPFGYKLIYVFEIPDERHTGILKIGDATVYPSKPIEELSSNCAELNTAARERIDSYTKTANIKYNLLHTELAIIVTKNSDGSYRIKPFRDYDVHRVLTNSGVKKHKSDDSSGAEWFEVDIQTVIKAIAAVKHSQPNLGNKPSPTPHIPIVFRPEQELAIQKTKKQFKLGNRMLWNAKMRFGKTLTALQVIKECDFAKTIIVTHRPVVDHGWYEDFGKIFYSCDEYEYGSKSNGRTLAHLTKSGKKFVYFASIQDLRGSSKVGGRHDKNDDVFNLAWDLVIVDEAHEGTTTALGDEVIRNLVKEGSEKESKLLALSGTPFNILNSYNDNSIYTWDYVMEQDSKHRWLVEHFGDSNPYDDLPELKIFTYDIASMVGKRFVEVEDKAFNFREFFRTWTGYSKYDHAPLPAGKKIGDFVHEKDVWSFLNLISREDSTNYPYSNNEFRKLFQHTLWIVPGVKEAKALVKLLHNHPVFGLFNIVNVAGEGDEEKRYDDALLEVQSAIKESELDDSNTITISCGKLTTGVSVPEWTAVLMLAGSFSTSASSYMQTIFRVQTPCKKAGMTKQCAYVFDFAPDRTLKMVASAVALSTRAGKTRSSDRDALGAFLNYCPVISISGSEMKQYDTNVLLQQLKRAYAERAVEHGFDDVYLYNDELLHLDEKEIAQFQNLKGIIGTTKASHNTENITINNQGFTQEEYEEVERIGRKKVVDRTPEEIEQLQRLKEQKKQRNNAISILRGISIRIPLLIYGADIDISSDITMEKLVEIVDDASWEEFMPRGVTKDVFKGFIKYYDPEIFVAAGRKIRDTVQGADGLPIIERIKRIAMLFSHFKNPDKETVLTPWRVVNIHMNETLGGFCFFDESYREMLDEPRYVDRGIVTKDIFRNSNAKVLEINSKTGLYPLYITYSIYRSLLPNADDTKLSVEAERDYWDSVLKNNVFVVCKTKMAKHITRRTLLGFRPGKINAHYFDDLINMFENKPDLFISKVTSPNYWKKEGIKMHFDAIVGNPPYQVMDGGNSSSSRPVYHHFVLQARSLQPKYISMIMPSRWFVGGKGLDSFRMKMLSDERISHIYDYPDYRDIFPTVDLAGGVCYLLWDYSHKGDCLITSVNSSTSESMHRKLNEFDILVRDNKAIGILRKVMEKCSNIPKLNTRVSTRKPFAISTDYKPQSAGIPCWFIQKYGLRYANPDDIKDLGNYLDKWKLLIPITPIAGQTDFTKPVGFYYEGNIFIAKPGECCTESFVICGAFDTEEEVKSFKSYILTKTVRFLLLQSVISQHVTQKEYRFVPDLQDYKGVYTDEVLIEKWGLSQDDWKYIDSRINNIGG